MREPVILEAVRTPFARAGGAFRRATSETLIAIHGYQLTVFQNSRSHASTIAAGRPYSRATVAAWEPIAPESIPRLRR